MKGRITSITLRKDERFDVRLHVGPGEYDGFTFALTRDEVLTQSLFVGDWYEVKFVEAEGPVTASEYAAGVAP